MASKKTFLVTDAVAALLSVVSLIGIFTVFAPCGPKEDGSWMVCRWAGNAVKGISLVLAVLSLIRLFIADEKIKIGLSLAVFAVAILETAVPGHLISLCMILASLGETGLPRSFPDVSESTFPSKDSTRSTI